MKAFIGIGLVGCILALQGCTNSEVQRHCDDLFTRALTAREPQAALNYGEFRSAGIHGLFYLDMKYENGHPMDKALVLDILDKSGLQMDGKVLREWFEESGDAAKKVRIRRLIEKQTVKSTPANR